MVQYATLSPPFLLVSYSPSNLQFQTLLSHVIHSAFNFPCPLAVFNFPCPHSAFNFPCPHSAFNFPCLHSAYNFPCPHSAFNFPCLHSAYNFPCPHSAFNFPCPHSAFNFPFTLHLPSCLCSLSPSSHSMQSCYVTISVPPVLS